MNDVNKLTAADFQKLLQIALQSLAIQRTLLENQMAELSLELRTLERDEELEKLDGQLLLIKRDYSHYLDLADPDFKFESYYD